MKTNAEQEADSGVKHDQRDATTATGASTVTAADSAETTGTAKAADRPEAKAESGAATKAEAKAEKAAEKTAAEAAKAQAAALAKANEETAKAQERVGELEKLNAQLQDQYLRKAADFDNYRKRMIKEKQDAIDYANSSLLVDLVEILDNFDRAIDAVGTPEAGTPAASFKEGIGMIRGQMGSMLESKYGLCYYPSKGVAFDPNLHEAIGTAESAEVKEATVAEEFTKGYKLRDRIIRHAKVLVHTPAADGKQ